MSEKLDQGLETEKMPVEETKKVKEQTPEEKALLVAGVTKMNEIGLTPNFAAIVATAPAWNDADKTVVDEARKKLVAHFGTSEALKDYLETPDFRQEMDSFQGIAKAMPTVNVIRSYYQRRANAPAKKIKTIQVSIDKQPYTVSVDAFEASKAIADKEERKAFILNHPDTKTAIIEEF